VWLDSGSFKEGDMLFEISNPRRLEYETTREFKEISLDIKE
jgi:hypothetical protein